MGPAGFEPATSAILKFCEGSANLGVLPLDHGPILKNSKRNLRFYSDVTSTIPSASI